MRIRVIALLGAAAVVTAACGTPGTPGTPSATSTETGTAAATSTPSPSPAPSPAPEPTACDELGGTDSGGTCTVHDETAEYTIDMRFPVDYPDQRAIIDLLTDQRDGFLELLDERPDRQDRYALDVTGTEYRSAGTVGVVFQEYVNVGGAHPTTNYDTLSYDLGTQAPITLGTLFRPGSDPVAVLDPIVRADLERLLDGYDVGPNPLGIEMYRNFAITDDAVIFFLGRGVWAFGAAGPREVSVPRSELADVLAIG